jgi:hypothetical protein
MLLKELGENGGLLSMSGTMPQRRHCAPRGAARCTVPLYFHLASLAIIKYNLFDRNAANSVSFIFISSSQKILVFNYCTIHKHTQNICMILVKLIEIVPLIFSPTLPAGKTIIAFIDYC